jgi:hypothetical protein
MVEEVARDILSTLWPEGPPNEKGEVQWSATQDSVGGLMFVLDLRGCSDWPEGFELRLTPTSGIMFLGASMENRELFLGKEIWGRLVTFVVRFQKEDAPEDESMDFWKHRQAWQSPGMN